MEKSPNPINVLEHWLSKFSEPDRAEVVEMALANICTYTGIKLTTVGEPEDLITQWFTAVTELPPKMLIGHLLAFIKAIEFFIMTERGSESAWEKIESIKEEVRYELLRRGHTDDYVEPVTKSLREIPLRKKRWLKQATAWNVLRSNELSDHRLMAWLKTADRAWILTTSTS